MELGYDFLEKLLFPLFGILLTAYATIYLNWRDRRRLKEDQRRQIREKVKEEQIKLVDELNAVFWRWRFLAKKIPYYAYDDPVRYNQAVVDYKDNIWDILTQIRTLGSRSNILFNDGFSLEFEKVYDYIAHMMDDKISKLISKEKESGFKEMASKLDAEFTDKLSTSITTGLVLKIARESGYLHPQ